MGLRKILAKKVLVFPFGRVYVKFFWGSARGKYFTEVNGNSAALADESWGRMVVPVNTFGRACLFSRRGVRVGNDFEIIRYLSSRLEEEFQSPDRRRACNIVQYSFLSEPCFSLSKAQIENIEISMSALWLPLGSSHGDLHIDNFIYLDGQLKIIDWAMYRGESSFVLDYMHYFCRASCVRNQLSWVDAIWLPIFEWQCLSLKCNVPMSFLRLVYAINRMELEFSQDSNLLFLKQAKYSRLVSRLVDSISE